MGIAAYHRGTKAISAHITQMHHEKNSVVIVPPAPPETSVVRVDENGLVWLLARKDKGWGEFGYVYTSWAHLRLAWNVQPSEAKQDQAGTYYEATTAN